MYHGSVIMNIEKMVEIGLLFEQYKELLTDKQREIVSLYYEEDYSLGEISENLNVSRQGVYDTLKRSEKILKDYENKLHLVEKLTILISTLILVFILLILGIIALFYLSFTLAYVLEPHVGGLMASYGIITGCIILLILLIVLFRKRLIVQPMVNFLANLLLNDN